MTPTSPAIDFDDFHRRDLPQRLATGNGALAAADLRGVAPLAFRLHDGRTVTYVAAPDTIRIENGDDGAETIVELAERDWQDFVAELHTAAGLVHSRRARFPRGGYAHFERWEPGLRAMFVGRPIYHPSTLALPARLDRAFAPDDPALGAFLRAVGFALVKDVFTPAEVRTLVGAAERLEAAAVPGDRRSWWARRADGSDVLCRITYASVHAPEIAALDDDARLRRFAALVGVPLRPAPDRCDGHPIVIKQSGVTEGLADLPWHRDCGLGGHPVMCPNLHVGIQLDAATPETGRLQFLAGSAGVSCHRTALQDGPVVALDTEPGDCTLHFGDVLHAAPPPTGSGRGRRALYVTFFPEPTFATIPPGKGYNDLLLSRDDGLVAATR